MKALLSHAAGGPETLSLEEVAEPRVTEDELLIQVRACGLNYPDLLVIEDKYQFRPKRPFAPGSEVGGEVIAVGSAVRGFTLGDRVIGLVSSGGLAERVAASAARCIAIPDAMPFDEAAAFLATYGTSYHALKQRAQIAPGESLLVLGAAGGVGLAAVELGRAMGARVIAAASTEEKATVARQHGATQSLVYPSELDEASARSLGAALKAACGPQGLDVVYDAVGGLYAEAALRAMAWRGRFLVVGFPAGIPRIALNLTLLKGCQIAGVFYGSFTEREPQENARNTHELLALYQDGKIRPRISARFSLAEALHGFALLASRKVMGKVVIVNE